MLARQNYASSGYAQSAPTAWGGQVAYNYPVTSTALVPTAPYVSPVSAYGGMMSPYQGVQSNGYTHGGRGTVEFNDYDVNSPYFLFSNFAAMPLWDDRGQYFPTATHLFQSLKFRDPRLAEGIRLCSTPQEAKSLAHSYQHRVRRDWHRAHIRLMEWVLRQKLKQHPYFLQCLQQTGRAYILNTSWDDPFWGIGRGRGRNELGKALMRLRKELRLGY